MNAQLLSRTRDTVQDSTRTPAPRPPGAARIVPLSVAESRWFDSPRLVAQRRQLAASFGRAMGSAPLPGERLDASRPTTVLQRELGAPWNHLPTLYKSPAQTRLIPREVTDALRAYFAQVHAGASFEARKQRLQVLQAAAEAWAEAMANDFPERVRLSDDHPITAPTTLLDREWAIRISRNLLTDVQDELRGVRGTVGRPGPASVRPSAEAPQGDPGRDRPRIGSSSPSNGYDTVAMAFAAIGVAPTRYVPSNETRQERVGEASANPTYRITYRFGRPNFTGYFKAEKPRLAKSEFGATKFGVPEEAPQLSARSVATYELAKALGLSEIPRTDYAVTTINGRLHPGAIMRSAGRQTIDKAADERDLSPEIRAAIRKSLSRLQMFDLLTGQTDRHQQNVRVSPKSGHVYGIDNDLALGGVDNLTNREVFGKVNTLAPQDVVADDEFASQLHALVGDASRLSLLRTIVTKHLGASEAEGMLNRLHSLDRMLQERQDRVTDWKTTPARYSRVIPNVGSFPAKF